MTFARQGQADSGVRFVDLHGSGRQDIIWYQDAPGSAAPGAKQNTGSGWKPTPDLTPPIPFSSANYNLGNSIQFADVDGDGYVDLVYGLSEGGKLEANAGVYFNKPSVSGDQTNRHWEGPERCQFH